MHRTTAPPVAELVQEILSGLREEVKEMAKTSWIFEGSIADENADQCIKV